MAKRGPSLFPRPLLDGVALARMKAVHSGTKRKEEVKKKISESKKRHKWTPEHRAAHKAAMEAYSRRKREEKAREAHLSPEERAVFEHKAERAAMRKLYDERIAQWNIDKIVAKTISEELYEDVRRSCGYWKRRRIHHPQVSDGYYQKLKRVMWKSPHMIKWRESAKKEY